MDKSESDSGGAATLTGRILASPDALLRAEVLLPQLRFEIDALLPWYRRLEKVLLLEYRRMELLDDQEVALIATLLDRAAPEAIAETAGRSMSDIAFALERFVATRMAGRLPAAWHVDRSRNDLQAAAQMLHGRGRVLDTADLLVAFGRSAHRLAVRGCDLPMPGYTHSQAAQVISPGFYLAGLCDQVLHTLGRLDGVYRTASTSPMGAGAMAGQELPWDRERMAHLLGCESVGQHALRAVAQRDWALEACAEFSMLGVALSRFATDLMSWGSAGYRFIDLPDAWSGISSAMPQKKNFPVLERIRARTAHLGAAYTAISEGQRNTPYSNSVEVSKEANAGVPGAFDTVGSVLRLFSAVLDRLSFDEDRMRAACDQEYLGGFTLANLLTLRGGVPWREAQVLAGRYVVAAIDRGLPAARPDAGLLRSLLAGAGRSVPDVEALLAEAMDVPGALLAKKTSGSVHPDAVRDLLAGQEVEFARQERHWSAYRDRIDGAAHEVEQALHPEKART